MNAQYLEEKNPSYPTARNCCCCCLLLFALVLLNAPYVDNLPPSHLHNILPNAPVVRRFSSFWLAAFLRTLSSSRAFSLGVFTPAHGCPRALRAGSPQPRGHGSAAATAAWALVKFVGCLIGENEIDVKNWEARQQNSKEENHHKQDKHRGMLN